MSVRRLIADDTVHREGTACQSHACLAVGGEAKAAPSVDAAEVVREALDSFAALVQCRMTSGARTIEEIQAWDRTYLAHDRLRDVSLALTLASEVRS